MKNNNNIKMLIFHTDKINKYIKYYIKCNIMLDNNKNNKIIYIFIFLCQYHIINSI